MTLDKSLGRTMILLKSDTKDALVSLKQEGESYDELIRRLIIFYEENSAQE